MCFCEFLLIKNLEICLLNIFLVVFLNVGFLNEKSEFKYKTIKLCLLSKHPV